MLLCTERILTSATRQIAKLTRPTAGGSAFPIVSGFISFRMQSSRHATASKACRRHSDLQPCSHLLMPLYRPHYRHNHVSFGIDFMSRTYRLATMSSQSHQVSSSQEHAVQQPIQPLSIQLPQYCCGCGIKMQQADPEAPGYFIVPAKLLEQPSQGVQAGEPDSDTESSDDYAKAVAAQEDMLIDDGEGRDQRGLPDVMCQRCFSLRHAGKVKNPDAEMKLPDFDLGKKVGRKIALQKDRRAVVLLVVDASDFDGSVPREALRSLYPPGFFDQQLSSPAASSAWEVGGERVVPPVRFSLMLALNKVDLLPKEATAARLIQWVKQRMAAAGLPKPDKVFCVSANKGTGVKDMLEVIKTSLGFRGDLWVVGAQNAGKSSVIAAMKRLGGTTGQRDPTIAPLAGTTVGLINVPGLPLGPKHRAFDTPGVRHDHQLTTWLSQEEVKQVLPGKSLAGRTWRTSRDHTILIGGLARIDIKDHPGATLYMTLYASPAINCHLGKTEGAEERVSKHVGSMLTPPASIERFQELPAWKPRRVVIEGTAWDKSTIDIHLSGLGWMAIGAKGRCELTVWVAPEVQVTTRPALVPDYAKEFCRPGFSISLPSSKNSGKGQQGKVAGGKNFSANRA